MPGFKNCPDLDEMEEVQLRAHSVANGKELAVKELLRKPGIVLREYFSKPHACLGLTYSKQQNKAFALGRKKGGWGEFRGVWKCPRLLLPSTLQLTLAEVFMAAFTSQSASGAWQAEKTGAFATQCWNLCVLRALGSERLGPC